LIRKRKTDDQNSITFRVVPENQTVHASHGVSLLDAILKAKIDIDHTCGGMGTCGTCRIFVEEGLSLLETPNEIESEIRSERGFCENERLVCQNQSVNGLVIRKP
jgi:ferredoxin, 2Fe-2S